MLKNILTWTLLLAAAQAPGWAQSAGPTSVREERSRAAVENPAGLMESPSGYEVLVMGGVTFEHAGRKYALKTIFSRARYDAGIETYKAGLRYQLSDYTTPDNITFWVPINPETTPVADYHNNYDGTKFRIESGKKNVEITAETNGQVKKYKLSIKEMLANWQENARSYRRELGGAVWHFVPQVIWHPRAYVSWYSRGYAISGDQPLDELTGRPLDAVRLCTSQNNWHGCEMGAYDLSMASGLTTEQKSDREGGRLKIEVIDTFLMRLIMRDELNGNCWHSNCEKPSTEFNDW